jgi:hypothetical protein
MAYRDRFFVLFTPIEQDAASITPSRLRRFRDRGLESGVNVEQVFF